ncbi:MAG: glycosyltransferase family 9 protein [bacterium]|nr:glycosyltransferase family 9 protein [bacterium]
MHIARAYSLVAGQKIDKINVLEKYYPLPFDNYMVIHPWSKNSKSYSFWEDVISIIRTPLKENGIEIVQVGAKNEKPLNHCYHTQGSTNIGNVAYIVSKAKLILSADSFCAHLAGSYNRFLVALYNNNEIKNVKPFFGDPAKQILLEPNRNGNKPCFAYDEHPKQIDKISPELIAQSVLNFLNLPYNYPYKTVLFGENYINKIIECIPNQIINPAGLGVDSLIIRADFADDWSKQESLVYQQAQVFPCSIVTNKPLNIDILKQLRQHIKQVVYEVTPNHDVDFVTKLQRAGLPFVLFSYMEEEELNKIKLSYLDIALVNRKTIRKSAEIKELEGLSVERLFYKSSKFTLSNGKIYPSKAALKNNLSIDSFDHQVCRAIDCTDFWKELEHFYLLKE